MEYVQSKLLSIGEFASLLNTTRATLLHYEGLGLLRPARIAKNGYRYYMPNQAQTYLLILLFSDCGLSLKEIRDYLTTFDEESGKNLVSESLQRVNEQIRKLTRLKLLMESKSEFYKIANAHEPGVPFLKQFEKQRFFQSTVRGLPLSQQQLQTDHSISICRYVMEHNGFPEYPFAGTIKINNTCKDDIELITAPSKKDAVNEKPQGTYACMIMKGTDYSSVDTAAHLVAFANELGYKTLGDIYMIDTVNFVITSRESEYSTLFQVRVDDGSK